MVAASGAASKEFESPTGLSRRLRQEEITDEIVELAAGAEAGRRR